MPTRRRATPRAVSNFINVDASALSVGVSITGSTGANTIKGGSGDDALDGAGGADTITAGAGNDTVIYHGTGNRRSTVARASIRWCWRCRAASPR